MSDCIIETKGLTKRYGDQVSVSSLDLHVQKGRIYGLSWGATGRARPPP